MPPPLEEMSEQLSLRAKISGKESIDRPVHAANAATASTTTMTTTASSSSSTKAEEAAATDKKTPNSNSLFKKGFLLGSNNSSSKGGIASGGSSASQQQRPEAAAASSPAGAPTPSQHNDPSSQSSSSTDARGNATIAGGMEIIKPKAPEQRAGVIPEVQDRMREAQSFVEKTQAEWINEALLAKLASNPELLRRFQDPKFMSAMQEFQQDPQKAAAKYQGNAEIQKFIVEFSAIMSEHFLSLDKSSQPKQQEPTSKSVVAIDPEQQKIDKMLKDPEVRAAMQDPDVMAYITALRNSPRADDQRALSMRARSNTALMQKLSVLVKAGVLGMAL